MPIKTITTFYHRKPLFCCFITISIIGFIVMTLYLYSQNSFAQGGAEITASTPQAVPVVIQEKSAWDRIEKLVGRIMLVGFVLTVVGAFIWYFVRGKYWDAVSESQTMLERQITLLKNDVAQEKLTHAETTARLGRSRELRLSQKNIILRLIARLEGDNKEYMDIMIVEEDDVDKP